MLKDFVHVAGPLGVTHLLLLTATENASYLKLARTPRVRILVFESIGGARWVSLSGWRVRDARCLPAWVTVRVVPSSMGTEVGVFTQVLLGERALCGKPSSI